MVILCVITNYFYIILYVGQPVGENLKKRTPGGRRRGIFFATTDTALPAFESRAEIAPEDQDSAESLVEFASAARGEEALKNPLSWTGITGPGRRYPPRTEDERSASRRPPIAGSPKNSDF